MKQKLHMLTLCFVLLGAILACTSGASTPVVPTGLPSIPTLDPNLSDRFEEAWQKAIVEAVATSHFSVTITEGQITDFINRKNAENQSAAVSDIQVFLRDGQIQVIGQTENNSGNATTLQLVATVLVAEDGKLQIKITSAQLGNLPIPTQLLDSLTKSINDALNGQSTTGTERLQIESIVIAEGYMTITGKIK